MTQQQLSKSTPLAEMWAVSVFVENTATLCGNIYVTTSIQQHSPLAENTNSTTLCYFVCSRQTTTKGLPRKLPPNLRSSNHIVEHMLL